MLIRRESESEWRPPEVVTYTNEATMQELVASSPSLLPLASTECVVAVRELPIAGTGSLDLLCIDDFANIALVECKLAANPDIRREVVGQIFAYASGLWQMSIGDLQAAVAARADGGLVDLMRERAPAGWDEATFSEALEENLVRGRFRLILAVDAITDELKRIVLFLNEHMGADVDVFAIELGYVSDSGVEILLPTTFGEESAVEKSRPQRSWTEQDLFGAWERYCPEAGAAGAKRLYQYVTSLDGDVRQYWGKGSQPSVNFWVGSEEAPWLSLSFYSDSVAVNFEWMKRYRPIEEVAALADRLVAVPGIAARLQGLAEAEYRRRPGLPIGEVFVDSVAVEGVIAAIEAAKLES